MANRKDPRGRTLKSGEVYRKDGRYVYTYTNPLGQRKYIYANDLVSLRRKEQELLKAQLCTQQEMRQSILYLIGTFP